MSFAEQVAVAANVAQVLGAIGTVAGIFYAAEQLRHNASARRANVLLDLENMSHDHDAVHVKLRPGGAWTEKEAGPATPVEWVQAEDYLGFFEHCEILMRQGSLDPNVFWSLYGWRLEYVLKNQKIVKETILSKREDWRLFWVLLRRFALIHRVPRMHPANDEAAHATEQVASQHS